MGGQAPACFYWELSRLSEVTIFATDACMLNPVGRERRIEEIRYRRRLKIFENFLFFSFCRSVVGTSCLAPSATSGPLLLQVTGKI